MEFDVVHHAEIKNQVAEALSRLETTGEDRRDIEDDIPNFRFVYRNR